MIVGFWSQVALFLKTYALFWVFFTFLEYVSPARAHPFWSRHQLTELLNGLFVAVFLWPLDSVIKLNLVEASFGAMGIAGLFQLDHWPLVLQVVLGLLLNRGCGGNLSHSLMRCFPKRVCLSADYLIRRPFKVLSLMIVRVEWTGPLRFLE